MAALWNVTIDENEEFPKYIEKVKKDKDQIEQIVNILCEENFLSFCDSLIEDDYYKEDGEEFKQGKSPIVDSFEHDCSYIHIELKYFSGWNDTQLFFQDNLIDILNSNLELRSLGYWFSGEDYLGIFIHHINFI